MINKELTAEEILTTMGELYATCKTYSDSGVVESTIYSDDDYPEVKRVNYKTAFKRNDRLRFEFHEEGCTAILWANQKSAKSFWQIRGLRESKDLGDLIDEFTLTTCFSAHTVPKMLMSGEVIGMAVCDLVTPEKHPDEKVEADGSVCYHIQGGFIQGTVLSLFIDKKTFLLRAVESFQVYKDFEVKSQTLYHPVINKPVDKSELPFNYPRH